MTDSCFPNFKDFWRKLMRDRTYNRIETQDLSAKSNLLKNIPPLHSIPDIKSKETNKKKAEPDDHFQVIQEGFNYLVVHQADNKIFNNAQEGHQMSENLLSNTKLHNHPIEIENPKIGLKSHKSISMKKNDKHLLFKPKKKYNPETSVPEIIHQNDKHLLFKPNIKYNPETSVPEIIHQNDKHLLFKPKIKYNPEIIHQMKNENQLETFRVNDNEINQEMCLHSTEAYSNSYESKFQESDDNYVEILEEKLDEKCFNCSEQVGSSEKGIIASCMKCKLCNGCLKLLFERVIYNSQNAPFYCNCGIPIYYGLFKSRVIAKDLRLYLEKISRDDFKRPLIFVCKCNYRIKKQKTGKRTFRCKICIMTYCLSCLESHEETMTCIEYFKINLKCSICLKAKVIDLECGCEICGKCEIKLLKKHLKINPSEHPICMKCNLKLSRSDKLLLSEFEKQSNRSVKNQLLFLEFQCPICYDYKNINESLTLECGHRSCEPCIISYLKTSVDNNSFPSGEIPCYLCFQAINPQTIENLLEGNCKIRYLDKLKPKTEQLTNKVSKFCNQCGFESYIFIGSEKFDCDKCKNSICAKCNKPYNKNCCENLLSYETLPKEMKGLVVNCPRCSMRIMKDNGCNFLRCGMSECGNTYFCFLCKEILTIDQHFTHYRKKGPFGKTCNGLDRSNS